MKAISRICGRGIGFQSCRATVDRIGILSHGRMALICLFALVAGTQAAEPWTTYRGNLQRTANTDGVAGPAAPKVLWVFKSQEHFIAAPVPSRIV